MSTPYTTPQLIDRMRSYAAHKGNRKNSPVSAQLMEEAAQRLETQQFLLNSTLIRKPTDELRYLLTLCGRISRGIPLSLAEQTDVCRALYECRNYLIAPPLQLLPPRDQLCAMIYEFAPAYDTEDKDIPWDKADQHNKDATYELADHIRKRVEFTTLQKKD